MSRQDPRGPATPGGEGQPGTLGKRVGTASGSPTPVLGASPSPARPADAGKGHRDSGLSRGRRLRIHSDSIAWLAAAALAFTLAVLLFTPLRTSLAWDETVYASQFSQHVPIMHWSAERARGMPLLVAPVTLITGSAVVIRLYVTLLGGVVLFLALLAWRGLRPAWHLAIAGVIFGGLAIVESQASQVFPNFWIALGGLAGTGLALQIITGQRVSRAVPVLLGVAAAFTSLMRPPDAVFIFGPLAVIAVVVMGQRSLTAVISIAAGVGVGAFEWAVEAVMYFHGLFARLHDTSRNVGGTKFDPLTSLRIINGGRASSLPRFPGAVGWSDPGLLVWWLAFALLAIAGVYAASRIYLAEANGALDRVRAWLIAAAPAIGAVSIYLEYALPVRDNARYLQAAWALLAVAAADGIAWLVTGRRGRLRSLATATATAFIVVELVAQHIVLGGLSTKFVATASVETHTVAALQRLGVSRPCVVTSVNRPHFVAIVEPAAYYLHCEYAGILHDIAGVRSRQVVVLVRNHGRPWSYATSWPAHKLAGTGGVVAYLRPRPAQAAPRGAG